MTVADLAEVSIRPADWAQDEAAIAGLRRAVFIREQGVPEALEWEGVDAHCDWRVAQAGGALVGIVRLTPDGRVGRMAVLAEWREKGIGTRLLAAILARAREKGLPAVALDAQVQAMPFYARQGFRPVGQEFLEAGIPHQRMYLNWQDD